MITPQIKFINCIELTSPNFPTIITDICNGHETLYEAIACKDDPRAQKIAQKHIDSLKLEGFTARMFIGKVTIEEIDC